VPRKPSPPKIPSFVLFDDGPVLGAGDIVKACRDSGAIQTPTDIDAASAAHVISEAARRAAGGSIASGQLLSSGEEGRLAQNVAVATTVLFEVLGVDPVAAAAGQMSEELPEAWRRSTQPPTPALLTQLSLNKAAALPPYRHAPLGPELILEGSKWFEVMAERFASRKAVQRYAREEPSFADAEAFLAKRPPPTRAQLNQGRAEAAIAGALAVLPDALGALLALARAVEKDARRRENQVERSSRGHKKVLMRGVVRGFRSIFGDWPHPRADNAPSHGADAMTWIRVVLEALAVNAEHRGDGDDSAIVRKFCRELLGLAGSSLANIVLEAVAAEKRS
jgi:hypothetical protein